MKFFTDKQAMNNNGCRVDLHIHSRFSKESDLWLLRQAGIGESNTDPETAYEHAKSRGMTYVTLTDHNTIEGGLRLVGHKDFFLSEEVTTYFPDEDVKLHTLALGITEEQHREIQGLRRNLYDLIAYFKQQGILYSLSHPLTRLGGELTPGHVERLMLLFPIWEVHNGSTLESENLLSRQLAESCTPEKLKILEERHDLVAVPRERITYTAGSDDHAGFDIASAYTSTRKVDSIAGYLAEIKAGRSGIQGEHGSTLKLADTMLGLFAHGVDAGMEAGNGNAKDSGRNSNWLAGWSGMGLLSSAKDSGRKWMHLVSLAVGGDGSGGLFRTVMSNADLRRSVVPLLAATVSPGKSGGEKFHKQLFSLVNAAWTAGMRSTLSDLSELNLFNFVDNLDKIGRLVTLQALLFPHSLSANYHSRQRHFMRRLRAQMLPDIPNGDGLWPRVGMFTDTYDEVNGVTSILRRLAEFSRHNDRPMDIITCGDGADATGRVVKFPAVASVHLPEYRELELSIPPVLKVIQHCEQQNFDVIHAATPGPMGLVAFMVSRILQVPFVSSFHTDVPRCVGRITDDKLNEEAAWTYTRWFYRRSDLTFAPSVYSCQDLASHGLDRRKVAVLYQGVDCDRFSPEFSSPRARRALGGEGRKLLLFVGRLSVEKDLRFLADAYLALAAKRNDVHLAFVGDGPLQSELQEQLGDKATFTGWLKGQDLAEAFASADLFVFPSTVDTSGQVILEAQASGLPVVLCTEGGAMENIEPGVTGLTAHSRSVSDFNRQIELLIDDDDLRGRMAAAARRSAAGRTWEKVFGDLYDTYSKLVEVSRLEPAEQTLDARQDDRDASGEYEETSQDEIINLAGKVFAANLTGRAVSDK